MGKGDLSDKISSENQLDIKANQLTDSYQLVQSKYQISNSSVLGYTRFKQPYNNKKLRFSPTLLDYGIWHPVYGIFRNTPPEICIVLLLTFLGK